MKEIELFYLTNCPYCHNARKAIDELLTEAPEFREIRVNWIEEDREPELAGKRDYFYVPTLFFGDQKLYEAQPGQDFNTIKTNIRQAFQSVLES